MNASPLSRRSFLAGSASAAAGMLWAIPDLTWAGNKSQTSAIAALAQFLRSDTIGSIELVRLRSEKIVAVEAAEGSQIDPGLIEALLREGNIRLLKTVCRLTHQNLPAHCNSSQWQPGQSPDGWKSFTKRTNWQFADGVVMTSRDIVYMQQQLKQSSAQTSAISVVSKPTRLMEIFCTAGMVSFSVDQGNWRAWDRDWNLIARS